MAFRDRREGGASAGREKHDRQPRLLGRRPDPVCGAVGQPRGLRAEEGEPDPEHTWLLPPFWQPRGRLGLLEWNAPHHGEALRIALRRLEPVVVAVARPRRRHHHDAVNAGLVHQRHQLLDGERLGQLRLTAGHPRPVRRLRLPQVDLRIDDRALACVHLPLRGSRALGREQNARADGAVDEIAP